MIKKLMTEKMVKKKNIIREALLAYCHDSRCTQIYDCPRNHYACIKKLDLDTAIAWQAADQLCFIPESYALNSGSYDYVSREHTMLISGFKSIVLLNLLARMHKDKYPKLHSLMRGANEIMELICQRFYILMKHDFPKQTTEENLAWKNFISTVATGNG
jgi:hypothetical protein